MTSTRFLIGVAVGAVGAWFLFGRNSGGFGFGVGGARATQQTRPHGRNSRYSGLRGQP